MENAGTLLESYQKVHQATRLDFSLVLLLLKIMGQFGVTVACVYLMTKQFVYLEHFVAVF